MKKLPIVLPSAKEIILTVKSNLLVTQQIKYVLVELLLFGKLLIHRQERVHHLGSGAVRVSALVFVFLTLVLGTPPGAPDAAVFASRDSERGNRSV